MISSNMLGILLKMFQLMKKSKKNSNSEMKKLKRLWMKKENKKRLSNRILRSNQILPTEESLKMEAASKAKKNLALK